MKRLYNALTLKKLLIQKELGVKFVEPVKEFEDDNINLPNSTGILTAPVSYLLATCPDKREASTNSL